MGTKALKNLCSCISHVLASVNAVERPSGIPGAGEIPAWFRETFQEEFVCVKQNPMDTFIQMLRQTPHPPTQNCCPHLIQPLHRANQSNSLRLYSTSSLRLSKHTGIKPHKVPWRWSARDYLPPSTAGESEVEGGESPAHRPTVSQRQNWD